MALTDRQLSTSVAHNAAAAIDAWRSSAASEPFAERAQAIADLLRSGARWDPSLFPLLLAIGRALGRPPGPRPTTLGDLLSAVNILPAAVDAPPWVFDATVDRHAFATLGYAAASAGIAKTQRDNREGWWAHSRQNRGFILKAAARVEQPKLAVVLGAGKAFDLPLPEMAARFERLVLIDIDAEALAETCSNVVHDSKLRRRIELRSMDLSGISARLARSIEGLIANAPDAATAEAGLEALCRSYRLAALPRLLEPGERADLLVSGMVLTQLALQPKLLAKQSFEQRFGPVQPTSLERWSLAWDELDLRLQQDHINALVHDADLVVLTSDVLHHSIYIAAGGRELPRGEVWSVIGADTLKERIPGFVDIVDAAEWSWPRIRPRPPDFDGVRTNVNGLVLRMAAGGA